MLCTTDQVPSVTRRESVFAEPHRLKFTSAQNSDNFMITIFLSAYLCVLQIRNAECQDIFTVVGMLWSINIICKLVCTHWIVGICCTPEILISKFHLCLDAVLRFPFFLSFTCFSITLRMRACPSRSLKNSGALFTRVLTDFHIHTH